MRIVVTMTDGNRFEIDPTDHDQFFNEETGGYGAVPSFFFGYLVFEDGSVSGEPSSLLGLDVNRVNYT